MFACRFRPAVLRMALYGAVSPLALGQTIVNLGTLPGGTNSHGQAVDAGGLAVVGYGDTPASGAIAFRWQLGGGIQPLGTVGPGRYSYGFAISDDGQVAGGRTESNGFFDRGFRWTPGGGMVDLGTLPGGFDSIVYGMSADGNRLAGWSDFDCCSGPRPVRWTVGGGIDNCGVLSTGFPQYSQGWAISADGTTVVGYSNSNAGPTDYRAVKWTPGGGLVDLGTLGGAHAQAVVVSGDASFISGWAYTAVSAIHAARWHAGGVDDLGTLFGQSSSFGTAITRDGSVVLGLSQGPGSEAYLWTETFGMESLTNYLAAQGVNLTGWILDEVNGVSANGHNIVGTGRFNGQIRGYLVRLQYPICGPRITDRSADQIGCVGGSVTMFCDVFGPTLLFPAFQWQKRGSDGEWNDLSNMTTPWGTTFSGVYTPLMTISNCAMNDTPGLYRCMGFAGCGSRPSGPIQVSLISQAPFFSSQPADVETCPDDAALFSAGPFSQAGAPYTFQWERETANNSNVWVTLLDGYSYSWDGNVPGNGAIISGASTGLLTIAPDVANNRFLGPNHTRGYRCVVSNPCGAAVSDLAALKVFDSCVQGDLNCDDSVSVGDIGGFVLILTNPAAYEAQFPNCNPANADINGDNLISVGDIGPFVQLLTGA